MTNKEAEKIVRRAFEIDRVLPFPRPKGAECLLGKMAVIGDEERSIEDILEDSANKINMTQEDLKLWQEVMFEWMPRIVGLDRIVVIKRCQGMGWKRLARYLHERKHTEREFDRTTLWRIFQHGINGILRNS